MIIVKEIYQYRLITKSGRENLTYLSVLDQSQVLSTLWVFSRDSGYQ